MSIKDKIAHIYRKVYTEQLYSRLYPDYFKKAKEIDSICIGGSYIRQWRLFKRILSKPNIVNICVIGVYYGRDIAYLATIAEELKIKNYHITGVDKFEDSYCEDWVEELKGKSWEDTGYGKPPNFDIVSENMKKLGINKHVTLIKSNDSEFLQNTQERFDFIYIDSSHDYKSVKNLIKLSSTKCTINGIIGGDDYESHPTFGVIQAVNESFKKFTIIDRHVWYANNGDQNVK
jgi:precorrin-6B methylase 2